MPQPKQIALGAAGHGIIVPLPVADDQLNPAAPSHRPAEFKPGVPTWVPSSHIDAWPFNVLNAESETASTE